jgi:thiamine biosynthesis protein ThiS
VACVPVTVMKKVWINGSVRDFEDGVRVVADALSVLGVPRDGTLVERNGEALFAREYDATPVEDGDRFELVRIAAGG